jgi:hypothetical protein
MNDDKPGYAWWSGKGGQSSAPKRLREYHDMPLENRKLMVARRRRPPIQFGRRPSPMSYREGLRDRHIHQDWPVALSSVRDPSLECEFSLVVSSSLNAVEWS